MGQRLHLGAHRHNQRRRRQRSDGDINDCLQHTNIELGYREPNDLGNRERRDGELCL
jgi:hypothetical protein